MWRCLMFLESFHKGKRILGKDQILQIVDKIFSMAMDLDLPPISEKKTAIMLEELQPKIDRQNLIESIFIPCLSNTNLEFNKYLSGFMFVKIDPMLEAVLNKICFESKKIIKNFEVPENHVQDILNSLQKVGNADVIKVGEVVSVNEGPYKTMIGRVTEIKDDIFSVHIQIFGVDSIIKLTQNQILIVNQNSM